LTFMIMIMLRIFWDVDEACVPETFVMILMISAAMFEYF